MLTPFAHPGMLMTSVRGSMLIVVAAGPPTRDEHGLVGQELTMIVSPCAREDASVIEGWIVTWTLTESSWLHHRIDG